MTNDLVSREGDEGHDPGALDGLADDALVLHAGAALATRENFSGGGGETLQTANILVVKFVNCVCTQVTGTFFERSVLLFRAHELAC